MKKILALSVVCAAISGCTYLGSPESYTLVEDNVAPAPAPAPVAVPQSVSYCATRVSSCGCGYAAKCSCGHGACQINPGVAGPLVVTIPGQSVTVQ